MERLVLKGRPRAEKGTSGSRRARRDGWVPANIYGGQGEENTHFEVRRDELTRLIQEEHHLMTLDIEGQTDSGLLKEIQFDAFGERIIHVDFLRVRMRDVIETNIPVHTMGSARGVTAGGTLDMAHHELPLKGVARDLPEHIEIEVTELNVDDAVRVKDIALPEGVEILLDPEAIVVAVHARKGVAAETPVEELEEGAEPSDDAEGDTSAD